MSDGDHNCVMIVEDEPDFREMLLFELTMRGYHVLTAANGQQALDQMLENPVAAIVTDIRMPYVNGFELLDRLKAQNVHTPAVILISGHPDSACEEAYHRGAEGLFSKPFRLSHLGAAVRRLLTPPSERWSSPPLAMPSATLTADVSVSLEGNGDSPFSLGRGGFRAFTSLPEPLTGRSLAFDFRFENGPIPSLLGVGTVRWTRPSGPDYGGLTQCGIEFEYVEDSSRDLFADWLGSMDIVPYIPASPGLSNPLV